MARLKVMSPEEWEEFIQEWASGALASLHGYAQVHRAGSAGDMGRDVIGYIGALSGQYDNFQCKHYDHALYPSDVWTEIGKLCYWSHQGEFSVPRRYRFVAPHGVGTSLLRLLEKPAELKKTFLEKWGTDCSTSIVSGKRIEMTEELRAHIESIDFSIFGAVPPVDLIKEHSATPYHAVRFGGGLPPRVDEGGPPTDIAPNESRYIRQLLDVYGEHAGCEVETAEDLGPMATQYGSHLKTSRQEFFSAECLNKFSRDWLPAGSFERLQEDVEDGVREVVECDYACGLERVRETTKHAKVLPIDGHPLRDVIRTRDKAGICHQLANEDRVTWMREKGNGT